jgi:hypothetical protein
MDIQSLTIKIVGSFNKVPLFCSHILRGAVLSFGTERKRVYPGGKLGIHKHRLT